jgi:hypothetical protein
MEQISYNMLFRWFVGLATDDAAWDASTFSKNRDGLMVHDVMETVRDMRWLDQSMRPRPLSAGRNRCISPIPACGTRRSSPKADGTLAAFVSAR